MKNYLLSVKSLLIKARKAWGVTITGIVLLILSILCAWLGKVDKVPDVMPFVSNCEEKGGVPINVTTPDHRHVRICLDATSTIRI